MAGIVTGRNNMNPKRLFVGNLTYSVDERQLWELFTRYGEIVSVRILEGKGYGFVEMESYEDARAARNALNETEFEGRNLLIDDVRPHRSRPMIQNRSGGTYQNGRPSCGRTAGGPGRRGPPGGDRGSRQSRPPSSSRSPPTRRRPSDYPERTLTSAPRPPGKETGTVDKKRTYKKPGKEGKPALKKTKTRYWAGGKR